MTKAADFRFAGKWSDLDSAAMRILPMSSSLPLAAEALVIMPRRFRPLVTAFVFPEALRLSYYWGVAYLNARMAMPHVLPLWLHNVVVEALTAVVVVAVIRFIVLAEPPQPVPRHLKLRTIALVGLFLVALWLPLEAVVDRHDLFHLYLKQHPASGRLAYLGIQYVWVSLGVLQFVLTVAGCAIVYPLVGLIACERRFHFSVWGKLLANNALSLILLATIIIASLAMAQTLYWQVMHFAFPSLAHYAPAALSDFDVRFETLYQLQLVPVSFAFEVFPAVVVGLLIKGLGLSSE